MNRGRIRSRRRKFVPSYPAQPEEEKLSQHIQQSTMLKEVLQPAQKKKHNPSIPTKREEKKMMRQKREDEAQQCYS